MQGLLTVTDRRMLNEKANRCTATTRTGDRCKNPAVNGSTVCRMHGGKGGGEPGNTNAVTTGEHETICYEELTGRERELWHEVDTGPLAQINEQIRLLNVRMRRMMARIGHFRGSGMPVMGREKESGRDGGVAVDIERERREHETWPIQRVEKTLTGVQKELRKLLREKYRILKNQPADNSDRLNKLLSRMAAMRETTEGYDREP